MKPGKYLDLDIDLDLEAELSTRFRRINNNRQNKNSKKNQINNSKTSKKSKKQRSAKMGAEQSHEPIDDSVLPSRLKRRDVPSIAEYILSGQCKKVVIMVS